MNEILELLLGWFRWLKAQSERTQRAPNDPDFLPSCDAILLETIMLHLHPIVLDRVSVFKMGWVSAVSVWP